MKNKFKICAGFLVLVLLLNILIISAQINKSVGTVEDFIKRDGRPIDRKSVVQGKSVDLGGRRIIKKKKHIKHIDLYEQIITIY